MSTKPDVQLFLSDARGIYVPRDFANGIRRDCVTGVAEDTWPILEAGPDHEFYWDAWDDVLSNATVKEPETGFEYRVYQNGDCWLVPVGMEWDESAEFYAWPNEESESAES